jgi:hypothetical protein
MKERAASHQIESGGNVHDIMTHIGFSWLEFTSIHARKRALISFLARCLFIAYTFSLQVFRHFPPFCSIFMTPLTALTEHVISGLPSLFL